MALKEYAGGVHLAKWKGRKIIVSNSVKEWVAAYVFFRAIWIGRGRVLQ